MIPSDRKRPQIDPRETVATVGGAEKLAALVGETGYRVQRGLVMDHAKALAGRKPHLVEGARGSGKTAFAEGLAEAFNMPVFYLQGMEGIGLGDVLYSWDGEGQNQWVRQSLLSGLTLDEARARQWSREYLVLGEALAAYEYAEREKIVPLLIVDEIDKCPEGITNMLLQLFGRGWAHVPRVGRIGVENPELMPVVVLTSNDMGRLSGPLRSRCVYTWIESPTAEEEVNILRSRVPGASALAIASVSKITDCLKTIAGIEERPALREEIDLLEAMTREGVDVLTLDNLEEYLCLIAKTQNDRLILLQSLARLEDWASSPNEAIDRWVRAACGDTRSESRLSTFAEAA